MGGRQEIHDINTKLDGLCDKMSGITSSISHIKVLEERQKHDKELILTLTEQVKNTAKVLVQINENLSTMNGERRGSSKVFKLIWMLFGAIITASILAGATSIINLNTKVAVLEEKTK